MRFPRLHLFLAVVTAVAGSPHRDRACASGWIGTVVTPHDLEWSLYDEASRRQLGALADLPGRGEAGWPVEGTAVRDAARTHAAALLRSRTTPPGSLSTPGAWLRAELVAVSRASDPHRQLDPPYADVQAGEDVDPALRAQVGLHLQAVLMPHVFLHFRLRFDTEGRNDPRNRTEVFPQLGASNNVDQAYLQARWSGVALTLGRMPLAWGPSPQGPLLLSATSPALDLLHVNLKWGGRSRLQAFAGELSSELADRDGIPEPYRRYLYGHRADLWPAQWLRLGLSETAVVAGGNESLSLRFANPVQFYAQAQTEEDGNDEQQVNVLDAVDAEVFLGPVQLYGSLVVDDLQIDAAGQDRNPDQLAWAVGFTASPSPDSPWWGGFELRRVGSWVGLHDGAGTDYRHFQRPLGAPEGPDTDRQLAFLTRWLGASSRARLDVERRRRGINRILTEDSRAGHAGDPFPRGRVEHRWSLRGSVDHWIGTHARVRAEVAWTALDRVNNGPDDLTVSELRLTLDLRGPAVSWRPAGDQ